MLKLKIEETNLKINRLMNSAIKVQNTSDGKKGPQQMNIQQNTYISEEEELKIMTEASLRCNQPQ